MTSRDGTRIGYLRQGCGPGVVLVQGAMADASQYQELAAALAPSLTVHSADRRGRGLSPKPYEAGHDIARDVEDIEAILAETGASYVFGLSSGAVITLEAARTLSSVTKVAVFEPPFYPDGISFEGIRRLNLEIERGNLGAGLLESLVTSGTAPAAVRLLPRPVRHLLGRAVIRVDNRGSDTRTRLRDLVPGVRYDFNVVGGMDGKIQTFASIHQPVLLISGTKSPPFLRQAVRQLQRLLPDAHLIQLTGLGHDGPWNTSRGGHPAVVAAALREFFAA